MSLQAVTLSNWQSLGTYTLPWRNVRPQPVGLGIADGPSRRRGEHGQMDWPGPGRRGPAVRAVALDSRQLAARHSLVQHQGLGVLRRQRDGCRHTPYRAVSVRPRHAAVFLGRRDHAHVPQRHKPHVAVDARHLRQAHRRNRGGERHDRDRHQHELANRWRVRGQSHRVRLDRSDADHDLVRNHGDRLEHVADARLVAGHAGRRHALRD